MPHPASEIASSATSINLFDLNLPEVEKGEAPLRHSEPTFDEQIAHAMFLLVSCPPDYYEQRLSRMNPEPFHLP